MRSENELEEELESSNAAPRLLFVVTHAQSAMLLRGQPGAMIRAGFRVAFASAPGPYVDLGSDGATVELFPVHMKREISLIADLRALACLIRIVRRWKPDVVNAGTPKAGLLGLLAARLTGVPVRVYVARGLRLETTTGLKRRMLWLTERISCACAQTVIAVSPSLAQQYVNRHLVPSWKVRVLGPGSSNGVQMHRFATPMFEEVVALRESLGIPSGAPVIGFVGRFTRDKGLPELVAAFDQLRTDFPALRLLLVGAFEAGDPVPEWVSVRIRTDRAIFTTGFVHDTAPAYALMDVLAFPSHREGFPNVTLEAAAAGLPVVGFRATGTVDAIKHGVTGIVVDVGDVNGLAAGLRRYLEDPDLRHAHGRAGQQRVKADFSPDRIWDELVREYDRLMSLYGSHKYSDARVAGPDGDFAVGAKL